VRKLLRIFNWEGGGSGEVCYCNVHFRGEKLTIGILKYHFIGVPKKSKNVEKLRFSCSGGFRFFNFASKSF